MAFLVENDKRWIDVDIGTRAIAALFRCSFVPYSLGTKTPFKEPKPSAPTDRHLYMLLPHAIGVFPPNHNYDLVVVATMTAKAFFKFALFAINELEATRLASPAGKKLEATLVSMPNSDNKSLDMQFASFPDQKIKACHRLVFRVHYCRVTHENGHLLSAPEKIDLNGWMFNRDLLARLHDSRHMFKKVRDLDAVADSWLLHAPSSVEYRAALVQLIVWGDHCGILGGRLNMLTPEMLVFCFDQGYANIDIRSMDEHLDRATIAKLLEGCMYKFVMGSHSKEGYLSIVTPSGRTLGRSVSRIDTTKVVSDRLDTWNAHWGRSVPSQSRPAWLNKWTRRRYWLGSQTLLPLCSLTFDE